MISARILTLVALAMTANACAISQQETGTPVASGYAWAEDVAPAPWSASAPFPPPEGDLAHIRGYAAQEGWPYTERMEKLALLNYYGWRLERERFPGYQQVWGSDAGYHVNVKPPFDRTAMLARAAPQLRPLVEVQEVALDAAEVKAMEARLSRILTDEASSASFAAGWDYKTGQFRVDIHTEEAAKRLRAALPADMAPHVLVNATEEPPVTLL